MRYGPEYYYEPETGYIKLCRPTSELLRVMEARRDPWAAYHSPDCQGCTYCREIRPRNPLDGTRLWDNS